MRKILRVTLQNATLTAPLGSLRLGLVVVHGKTEAGGNGGNGNKTVAMLVMAARQWQWRQKSHGNGQQTVRRWLMGGGNNLRWQRMRRPFVWKAS
jgi:hypothetical protein